LRKIDIKCVDFRGAYITDEEKCKRHTRGLLRRMTINGGLQHCIGKKVSRFEQGKDDFIENIDDVCIHYDGERVAANESLIAEVSARGLRKTTKQTKLDRKTIRRILNRKKVKASRSAPGSSRKQSWARKHFDAWRDRQLLAQAQAHTCIVTQASSG